MRKLGSNLDLKGIVIHQVSKIAGDRNVSIKNAKSLLSIGVKEQQFVGKLNIAYYKKSNPTYGIFGDSDTRFRDLLDKYLADGDLYKFSIDATSFYKIVLGNTTPATGGFLMFIDYINADNSNRYLLTLTVTNKDGFVVSETDLSLQDVKNLDLNKVDTACMINITKWKEYESGFDTESKTYLSFIKGSKGVSHYFMSYIDCDNKTTNADSTKRLTRALNAFAQEKGYDRDLKIRKKNEVFAYCDDCLKEKKEIKLSAISAIVEPDDPNDFLEFASEEEFGVSETIKGDKSQLNKLRYVMYKDKNYRIEFSTELLGKDVVYSKIKNELTFKRLPEELISQIPL